MKKHQRKCQISGNVNFWLSTADNNYKSDEVTISSGKVTINNIEQYLNGCNYHLF